MLRVDRVIKPWKESAALNDHINLYGFWNRDMAAIEAIHPDGRLSVRLDNNRQIEFNPNEHRHLDHGYAVTSHSSQGLTAERVLVHADTSVHPDLLNSRLRLRLHLSR